VDDALLTRLLADLYFRRPPPKSTGREHFGQGYVDRLIAERQPADDSEWADLIATLTMLVARSIAEAVRRWAPVDGGEVVVTGGGAENPVVMEWLGELLDPVAVHHGRVLGLDPAAKEAVAFAVLAWAHVSGRPANVPEVTGAAGPRVLGSHTPA
jgi:anhydro-N-acetylmuramic acid kinase